MRAVEIRGRLEQRVLISYVLATTAIFAFAILFRILTGSFSILFDGFYALIDAAMAAVGRKVAPLILRDVLQRDDFLYRGCRLGVLTQPCPVAKAGFCASTKAIRFGFG